MMNEFVMQVMNGLQVNMLMKLFYCSFELIRVGGIENILELGLRVEKNVQIRGEMKIRVVMQIVMCVRIRWVWVVGVVVVLCVCL